MILALTLVSARADAEGSSYFQELSERNAADATAQALAGSSTSEQAMTSPRRKPNWTRRRPWSPACPSTSAALALAGLLPGGGPSEEGATLAVNARADQTIADLEFVLAARDQFPAALLRAAYQGLARAYHGARAQAAGGRALRRSGLGPAATDLPPTFTSFSMTRGTGCGYPRRVRSALRRTCTSPNPMTLPTSRSSRQARGRRHRRGHQPGPRAGRDGRPWPGGPPRLSVTSSSHTLTSTTAVGPAALRGQTPR